jgi:hypothetical protein
LHLRGPERVITTDGGQEDYEVAIEAHGPP